MSTKLPLLKAIHGSQGHRRLPVPCVNQVCDSARAVTPEAWPPDHQQQQQHLGRNSNCSPDLSPIYWIRNLVGGPINRYFHQPSSWLSSVLRFENHCAGILWPGNTGVGCHSLLQGIFLTQWLNLGLLNCRQILYHLSYQRTQCGTNWSIRWKWKQLPQQLSKNDNNNNNNKNHPLYLKSLTIGIPSFEMQYCNFKVQFH